MENNNKQLEDSIKRWRRAFLISVFLFLFTLLAVIWYSFQANYFKKISDLTLEKVLNKKVVTEDEETPPANCTNCVRRYIDGVFVEKGKENVFPLAVMIDNLLEARPAFGLAQANLVYEAEAEGGVTRYLAVFASSDKVEKIGPIRSARPYFIDWVEELSSAYIHCGGSPDALAKIVADNVLDLNEFYHGDLFWREEGRDAPHNILSSTNNLRDYLVDKKIDSGKFLPWQFKEEASTKKELVKDIEINFQPATYAVKWQYNSSTNEYVRYLGGEKYQTAEGLDIRAKNIIIQTTKKEVLDDKLRLKLEVIGENKAVICLDGACQLGTWKKVDSSSRTRYYYNNGDEVKFNAGTTWIEIVGEKTKVDF
ncbi:MAG: DUF3048 domain-containing protein [Planctomycetes bacterium]|nr:DUF3048 domain-containing protein [Planctomycetota bacterium]